jgi:hypothetical protein
VLFLGYITTWLLILDCIDLPNKYLNVHYKQGWMMIELVSLAHLYIILVTSTFLLLEYMHLLIE